MLPFLLSIHITLPLVLYFAGKSGVYSFEFNVPTAIFTLIVLEFGHTTWTYSTNFHQHLKPNIILKIFAVAFIYFLTLLYSFSLFLNLMAYSILIHCIKQFVGIGKMQFDGVFPLKTITYFCYSIIAIGVLDNLNSYSPYEISFGMSVPQGILFSVYLILSVILFVAIYRKNKLGAALYFTSIPIFFATWFTGFLDWRIGAFSMLVAHASFYLYLVLQRFELKGLAPKVKLMIIFMSLCALYYLVNVKSFNAAHTSFKSALIVYGISIPVFIHFYLDSIIWKNNKKSTHI